MLAAELLEVEEQVDELPLREGFACRIGRGEIDAGAIDRFLAACPVDAVARWFGDVPTTVESIRLGLDRDIAAIDAALSAAVVAIIGHARFRALEAAWQGVAWLTAGLPADETVRLRLLDTRWSELARDLERAPEFDRSALFVKIYEEEFGTPGGVPFSLLIALHEVRHRPGPGHPVDDIATLRQLAMVAAAAFTPIVLDASPALFAADTHGDLDLRRSLSAQFRRAEYGRFQALQRHPDTRFLGLVAPRIIVRAPWSRRPLADLAFRYSGYDAALTAGGALAVAHVAIRAFAEDRWPAAITGTVRDVLGGGLVTGLPEMSFATDRPAVAIQPPIDLNLSDAIDRELNEAGVITLRRVRDTPWLAIHSLPSLHRSTVVFDSGVATANARLSAMLNYMLCVARFAHYIKIIGRDLIGSTGAPSEVEARLQRWLNTYTTTGDRLSSEMQARYPLEEARIQVVAVPERPGSLECSVWLKPHFHTDQAVSEFHLVTVVSPPSGA